MNRFRHPLLMPVVLPLVFLVAGCPGGDDKKAMEAYKAGEASFQQAAEPYSQFDEMADMADELSGQVGQLEGEERTETEAAIEQLEVDAVTQWEAAAAKYSEAVQHFTTAISHKQDFGEAYMAMGLCYYLAGEFGKSAASLQQAQEIFGQDKFVEDVHLSKEEKTNLVAELLPEATANAEREGQQIFLPPIPPAGDEEESSSASSGGAGGAAAGKAGQVGDRLKNRMGQRAKFKAMNGARRMLPRAARGLTY